MGHKSNEEIRDRIDHHKMLMATVGFAAKSCLAKRISDLEWVLSDREEDGIPEVTKNLSEVEDDEQGSDTRRIGSDTSPGSGGAVRQAGGAGDGSQGQGGGTGAG